MDADYLEDLDLSRDAISDATLLVYSLKHTSQDIGLFLDALKMELIYSQQGPISALAGEHPHKQMSKFVSEKAWITLDALNTI